MFGAISDQRSRTVVPLTHGVSQPGALPSGHDPIDWTAN